MTIAGICCGEASHSGRWGEEARECLGLEVVARDEAGAEDILWAKRYDSGWQGKTPTLEALWLATLAEAPQGEG